MSFVLRVCFTATILLVGLAASAPLRARPPYTLGDTYFANREYEFARLEYDRILALDPADENARARAALALMRLRKYKESVRYLEGPSFCLTYLRLFALLRSGQIYGAQTAALEAKENRSLTAGQKEELAAIEGLILIERGQNENARAFYGKLQREAESADIRRTAGAILSAQLDYEQSVRKSPMVGGFLSALLPGSGQAYAGHYADALSAFFFNAVFLGSAAAMYALEQRSHAKHNGSVVLGAVGLVFYAANIVGGASAAVHFNLYQERMFHEKIRQDVLNVERAERAIQIRISVPIRP